MVQKTNKKNASYLYSNYEKIWEAKDNTLDTIFSYIQDYYNVEMDSFGNITVTNSDLKNLPGFCCHLDTVHKDAPEPELLGDDILLSFDNGIGGDDKCGIVACLELLKYVPCKCVFFREEETGCKGSHAYDTEKLKDCLFLIEIDRKGGSDLIFVSGGEKLCDNKFKEEVKSFFPHGKEANGIMTDVNVLGKANINMMNLSAGYYNPHTDKEYVVLSELERNIRCLVRLANEYREKRTYEREVKVYGYLGQYQKDMFPGYGNEYGTETGVATEDDWYKLQYGEDWKEVKEEDEKFIRRCLRQ